MKQLGLLLRWNKCANISPICPKTGKLRCLRLKDDIDNKNVFYTNIPDKLIVKTDRKVKFIELKSIKYFEAYDYLLKIHTTGGTIVVREPLHKILSRLPENDFIQIHRSYIINLMFLKEIEPSFNNEYAAKLIDGKVLKVSRNFKNKLLDRF